MFEQRFAVYMRDDLGTWEVVETQIAEQLTYAEARRLRREMNQVGKTCVIRFTGETGGSE
jgi:hypothetical protein